MKIDDFNPVQTTPYSVKLKLKIYLWKFINKTIFRIIPNQLRKPRILMLRLFGANLASSVFIHRKSNIEHPWNLTMGHLSSVGENSWIYCLDKIIIGQKCTIGKDCYLITGSHDVTDFFFSQLTKPIIIKDGTWVTTGVYIMPGVIIEEFNVIGAKSLVLNNTQPFSIVAGNPAKFIKNRIFQD
jgi:putative colanic acid biosynthesis acetyltransferase WcaF